MPFSILRAPARAAALVALLGVSVSQRLALGQAAVAPASTSRVQILNPLDSAQLTGRSVPVVLQVEGVAIAPVAVQRQGTAHYHLFLDRDLTPLDSAIPTAVSGIVHLNRGQSWYTFEGLLPGPHRLIAVLADPKHVPLKPLVADTVHFTVRQKSRR